MNRKGKFRLAVSIMTVSLLAACATTTAVNTAPVEVSYFGEMTNLAKHTLYTYDKDAVGSGTSACNGACARTWSPLLAGPQDVPGGDYSIIARTDGTKQWAFKGKPVYLFSGDKEELDKHGDKIAGAWHVLRYPYIFGAVAR